MMLFEVGVRMERTLENGAHSKVLEQFVVDAYLSQRLRQVQQKKFLFMVL